MSTTTAEAVGIPFVCKGRVDDSRAVEHRRGGVAFATPAIELDALVWPRTDPLPAAQVPLAEIVDLLAAVGDHLRDDVDGHLADALEALSRTSQYERRILENSYAGLAQAFAPERVRAMVEGELGDPAVLDGWKPVGVAAVRAYPSRIVHVLAGNAPGIAASTVVRGAVSKGVHLLKLPSNDLLTATAILRAMAAVAPDHPTTQSFSAVYWAGGDDEVEGALLRPQFFEKLMAWGGESAIRNALKYVGPGFELISFDPKSSISLVGREAFEPGADLDAIADAAAADATPYDQEACIASRFQFVEGDLAQVDAYCEALQLKLGLERPLTAAVVAPPPQDLRDELDALAGLPMYRVFGRPDGRGMVVRSDEPVDFSPSGKIVNVVAVDRLEDAVRYVNVSTQTIGIHPPERGVALRDALAGAGAQRIVPLGAAATSGHPGLPHDGFYPLHRMVRWISSDQGGQHG